MADQIYPPTDDAAIETAEMAFRRIARRKLIERRVPENQIDSRLTELLRKGPPVRIDVDEILGP